MSETAAFTDDGTAGTLRFSSPVLSRTSNLDPQFIVINFEVDGLNGGEINAGARATWRTTDDKVRIGVTGIRDAGDSGHTTIAAADARVRIGKGNEVRAEVAASHADGAHGVDTAWQVEAEHHDSKFDVLAYARQQAADYGVSEQNLSERGRRKFGVDASVRLTKSLSASGSAWSDHALDGSGNRIAMRAQVEYRTGKTDLRVGVTHAQDSGGTVPDAQSTLLEAGATQRLFDKRLCSTPRSASRSAMPKALTSRPCTASARASRSIRPLHWSAPMRSRMAKQSTLAPPGSASTSSPGPARG